MSIRCPLKQLLSAAQTLLDRQKSTDTTAYTLRTHTPGALCCTFGQGHWVTAPTGNLTDCDVTQSLHWPERTRHTEDHTAYQDITKCRLNNNNNNHHFASCFCIIIFLLVQDTDSSSFLPRDVGVSCVHTQDVSSVWQQRDCVVSAAHSHDLLLTLHKLWEGDTAGACHHYCKKNPSL